MAAQPLIITAANGETIEVQTTLEDTLAFEQFLRRNKRWGGLQDNALKLAPFKAFSAARRLGRLPAGVETWEQFTEGSTAVLDVQVKREDDDEDDDSEEVEGLGESGRTAHSTD